MMSIADEAKGPCPSAAAPCRADQIGDVGARYEPKDGKITAFEPFISKTGERADMRKQTPVERGLVRRLHRRYLLVISVPK
jgi:hypothetical protein